MRIARPKERQGKSIPCDSIRQTTLDLGKLDATILTAALNALGWNATQRGTRVYFDRGEYNAGQLTTTGAEPEKELQQIKRAYSAELVKAQARKYGWNLKQTAQGKFQVIKNTL